MWRRVRLSAVAVIVVGGLAACEPPPPPVVLEVNSVATSRDADPGDGVCETAPGNGECTVAAAIDEGNAAGRAVVRMLDASAGEPEPIIEPMSITGDLTLFTDGYQNSQNAWLLELHVEPGAILRLDRAHVIAEDVSVGGTLLLDRSTLYGFSYVAPSGRMLALNSILNYYGGHAGPHHHLAGDDSDQQLLVDNHGQLWVRFSWLGKDAPVLHTAHGATTRVGASTFTEIRDGACTGEPVESEGYNEERTDCANTPTDGFTGHPNQIPVGELGCGTDVIVDYMGRPRPTLNPDLGLRCSPGPDQY